MKKRTKVGPAFFESISHEKVKTYRQRSSILPPDFLKFIPLISLFIVFGLLFFRLFYLQILRGDYYKRLADENRLRSVLIPAPRGILFDHTGKPLVSNSPAFKIIDLDRPQGEQIIWLKKEEALKRMAEGKEVEADIQRSYLYKTVFAHVLGYVGQISEEEIILPQFEGYGNSDFIGKMGLEKQYESLLHGKNGRELYEVDATGKKVRFLGKEEEIAGRNLTTTLDVELQVEAQKAMREVTKGAVVISDPRDGAVRVLYSKPSFDPNIFTHADDYTPEGEYSKVGEILNDNENQPMLDRAISGLYPPASTYKLITSIAALETGAISKNTRIEDTGVLRVGAFSYGNWYFNQYGRKDGKLDVIGALRRSNDIFYYKIADETGITALSNWSKELGLGTQLGIDLPGESKGIVPDPVWKKEVIGEQWYLGDIFNMGIGQGYLLSTPLQVNTFTIPFANEGVMYKPHLIEGQSSILKKNFMKDEHAKLIRQGMKEACEPGGTGAPFFDFKVFNENLILDGKNYMESASGSAKMTRVSVGCKTGTAEAPGGEDTKPHAWFTVFAPFHDPEIVVTVLAENAGEGSQVAAPIAKEILTKYFEGK